MNRAPLILASGSPRRKELLDWMGLDFEVVLADVEETETGNPETLVRNNSLLKARAVQRLYPDRLILGADTIVCLENEVFGKPADPNQAAGMISALSGRWHEVLTGVALLLPGRELCAVERTRVHFVDITPAEIARYVQTAEPYDKAGAYAVQGHAGMWVDRIEGSYSNVIGLPQALVRDLLIQADFNL